jgi:hypothetical protein
MRKILWLLMALIAAAALTACNSDGGGVVVDPNASAGAPSPGPKASAEVSGAETAAADTLYYESNGVKIHVYDLADDVLARLGEPNGTFESDSCAYQGKDYFFYYNGFQLTVNDVDGAKHVTAVKIVDDTVAIPQGVKIGSPEDEMKRLMGDNYTESAGQYVFTEINTTLQIIVKEAPWPRSNTCIRPPVS